MRVHLTLYAREGCHLCDDMKYTLESLKDEFSFELEVIDVDEAEALRRRFNDKVPVLARGEDLICHHFLDAKALREALTRG